jgi:hypothetical protein
LDPSLPTAGDPALRPFLDAVVQHLSFASGEAASDARRSLFERLAALVQLAVDDETVEEGARELAADPPMLASFFQNADLLHVGAGYAHAAAVGAMVMRAVELIDTPVD